MQPHKHDQLNERQDNRGPRPNPYILVVDDEPDIRNLLQEILEDEGYEVSIAENGETARQAHRERRPDLVLLDIWMPDVDGISLLKEWSEDGAGLPMPVIMMSGHGTVETAVEATREAPVTCQVITYYRARPRGRTPAAGKPGSAPPYPYPSGAGGAQFGDAALARTGQAHRPARYLDSDVRRIRLRDECPRPLPACL